MNAMAKEPSWWDPSRAVGATESHVYIYAPTSSAEPLTESPQIEDLQRIIRQASDTLRQALPSSARGASDDGLLGVLSELAQLRRLTDAASAVFADEVRARSHRDLGEESLARRHGRRDAADLVQFVTRQPRGQVNRVLRLGRIVAPRHGLDGAELAPRYSMLTAAILNGEVDPVAATTIAAAIEDAPMSCDPAFVAAAEECLVGEARMLVPELVDVEAKVWRAVLDPDGSEPRDDRQRRLRSLTLSPIDDDGMSILKAVCPPEQRALLQAVFDTYDNPRTAVAFLDADADADAGGSDGSDLRDPRSRVQRRFDILFGVLTAGLRASETDTGNLREISKVVVTATIGELETTNGTAHGTAWLDGVTEPVSAVTAHRLACDAGLQQLILGTRGEVLALGTRTQFFTAAQRSAIGVRDGGCIWPGCTAPPAWCEAHHVVFRRDNGPTDVDNGVLLCSAHHHLLHNGEWNLRMVHGIPHLQPPPWLDPDRTWRRADRGRTRKRQRILARARLDAPVRQGAPALL